jgi:hypothetical protein
MLFTPGGTDYSVGNLPFGYTPQVRALGTTHYSCETILDSRCLAVVHYSAGAVLAISCLAVYVLLWWQPRHRCSHVLLCCYATSCM